MSNKMLIDAIHPEETRVVVLKDKRVEDFDFETASRKPLRGNIYLAKVTRVEPSLQAAFIEYGGNKHGFLAFSEIHPDYYQIPQADRQALIDEMEEEEVVEAPKKPSRRRSSAKSTRAAAASAAAEAPSPATDDTADESDADTVTAAAAGAPEDAAETVESEAAAADAETDTQPEADAGVTAEAEAAPETETAAVEAQAEDDAPVGDAPEADATEAAPAAEAGETEAPAAETDGAATAEAATGEEAAAEPEAKPKRRRRTTTAKTTTKRTTKKSDDGLEAEVISEDDDADQVTAIGESDALEEIPERRRRAPKKTYKIQEVIKRRQILLVQVVKEERGTKGAALTTYLSLAGRYSVLMPNTNRGGGVSRKITDNADRKRLKSLVSELDVPQGMGIILRTAGASRTKTEIKRDFEYLLRLWESVRDLTLKSIAPELVYEEGNLVKRAIRDLYSKEIGEVLVSGDAAYREAKDFMKMLMPSHAKNVKPYREPTPIFTAYGVEPQLDAMFSPTVMLPSKGSIVINPTEALVAIDVNSGKSTKESNIEDTATKTNLEAADEVARQLRLRDLAGLIVIDFIDMDDKRHIRQVEKRLKDALKMDRSRIQVGRISPFGLMEMSRQRIRQGMVETSVVMCPTCNGSGHVRSTQSVALYCLRALEEHLLKKSDHHVTIRTSSAVALYILNQKRGHLNDLEERFGLSIGVHADGELSGQHMEIVSGAEVERAPGEAPPVAQLAPDAVDIDDEDGEDDGPAEDETQRAEDNGGERSGSSRRRRRRRRRGGGGEDQPAAAGAEAETGESAETEVEAGAAEEADGENNGDGDSDSDGEDGRRSRRRRGRRGGRRHRREGEGDGEAVASGDTDGEAVSEAETETAATDDAGSEPEETEATAETVAEASDTGTPAEGSEAVEAAPATDADAEEAESEAAPAEAIAVPASAEPEDDTAPAETEGETVAVVAAEPAEEAPEAPENKSAPRPRRVGWWQRRSFF